VDRPRTHAAFRRGADLWGLGRPDGAGRHARTGVPENGRSQSWRVQTWGRFSLKHNGLKGLTTIPLSLFFVMVMATAAFAQSGHFVGTPTCTDVGTQLRCSGKVAGLGGETFRIEVSAEDAVAIVQCENPAGNVAPGQNFTFDASGSTGNVPTTRNGQFAFRNLRTAEPTAPAGSCPNPQWTATVTDVQFSGSATLTLFENGTVSDTITVSLS
jgi:hypothetical protein